VNFEEANQLLDGLAPGAPPFVQHSRVVAGIATRVARALAEGKVGIDVERIRVRALLHDLGRSRTHGNYHGWVGYAMLRRRGLGEFGRGCVTHWLRGLELDEALELGRFRPRFLKRVFEELDLPRLEIDDFVVSVADFSVAHTTIVSLEEREADLVQRYGDSRWLRRNGEVARDHRALLEAWMGRPLAGVVPETAPRGARAIEMPKAMLPKELLR
jgi:putative nucleotidyltransferase with HDIG domain